MPPGTDLRSPSRRPAWLVPWLCLKDLLHEPLLTLCLAAVCMATLTPLLILFGLKSGIIDTLRSRLMEDPKNREIRPRTNKSFTPVWFKDIRMRPEVAFVSPATRQLAVSMDAWAEGNAAGEQKRVSLDAVPTGPNDPLLGAYGKPAPGRGQCVLSTPAAESLGVLPGGTLRVSVSRITDGRIESTEFMLDVAGVLPIRAEGIKAAYLPLVTVEAMEHYKDGLAVPEFGWPEGNKRAQSVFDGAVAVLPAPLDEPRRLKLAAATSFSDIRALTPGQDEAAGYTPPAGRATYLFRGPPSAVDSESLENLALRMRDLSPLILPWIRPLEATLSTSRADRPVHLQVLPNEAKSWIKTEEGAKLEQGCIPAYVSWDFEEQEPTALLTVTSGENRVTFPVCLGRAASAPEVVLMPENLAGVLNSLRNRPVAYDPTSKGFVAQRRGYASFRLYARSIDDVAPLIRFFEAQNIDVLSQIVRIDEVRSLDSSMSIVFRLVAVVTLAGGFVSLAASLYAQAERKKALFGSLRLLGLRPRDIIAYPVCQGLYVAGLGAGASLMLFYPSARVMDALFQKYLQTHESLCALSPRQTLGFLAVTLAVSCLAGAAAAWRLAALDPAEAIRMD